MTNLLGGLGGDFHASARVVSLAGGGGAFFPGRFSARRGVLGGTNAKKTNQSVEPPCGTCAAFSCFSWSSRQCCAQGMASRRAASIGRPQDLRLRLDPKRVLPLQGVPSPIEVRFPSRAGAV